MCIDCLDAPGDTMPAERELLFASQISQDVEAALKKKKDRHIAKVIALKGKLQEKRLFQTIFSWN